MNCCLCEEKIESKYGRNNAEPVSSGECCNNCNEQFVIPHRLAEILK